MSEATPTTESAAPQQVAAEQAAATEVKTPAAEATKQVAAEQAAVTEVKTPAAETEKPAEAAKPRAPEKYEFEGFEGTASAVDFEAFGTLARELDLSQADAQKLVDFQAQRTEAARAAWLEAAKTDKEFGGDKLAENLGVAAKALDAFGSPELNQLLIASGLGNHPEIIRAFYRAGKAISEDRIVTGAAPAAGRTLADRLYPQSH